MNDILKAAGIAAATIVGMYAGEVVCAIATNAIIKRGEEQQPQAQVAG